MRWMSRASLDELKQEPPIHAMYGTHCVSRSLSLSLPHSFTIWAIERYLTTFHFKPFITYESHIVTCNTQITFKFHVVENIFHLETFPKISYSFETCLLRTEHKHSHREWLVFLIKLKIVGTHAQRERKSERSTKKMMMMERKNSGKNAFMLSYVDICIAQRRQQKFCRLSFALHSHLNGN